MSPSKTSLFLTSNLISITDSIYKNILLSGTDLPDDDYTTLVPPPKPTNANNNRNPSKIQIIIGDKEKDSTSTKNISNKKNDNRQKTIITGVSRRRSTMANDSLEYTRSAPSSPTLNHTVKQGSSHIRASLDPNENEIKSASSEYYSLSANDPSNSLSPGTLEVRLKYDAKNSKMWVFVIKATLDTLQHISKQTLVQVHLTVLPSKRIRFRTRVKSIDNAMFAEEFFCKVSPETIKSQGIRFRLYTYERLKRVKLLAEATVMFAMVNLDEDMCKIVPFERAYPSQDSDLGSRSTSRHSSIGRSRNGTISSLLPELEIGLAYDKNQSILVLEIGKGINFCMASQNRAPDTYVQITLCNSIGEQIVVNRTAIQHAQHHPVYAERYPYNIQDNMLDQITVAICVFNKKSANKPDRDFGWISFGHDASGTAQIAHWDAMLNAQGKTITRWHALLDR